MQYEFETIPQMWARRLDIDADRTALHLKRHGQYESLTWSQVIADIFSYVTTFEKLGVRPGDRVVQFAENRYEWILSDAAIQILQAVHVPIHAPLTGEQVVEQIRDCGATLAIVSTSELMTKVAGAAEALDGDMTFVMFDSPNGFDPQSLDGRACHVLGDVRVDDPDRAKALLRDCLDNLSPDSLATILYTSGTTGEPKGVMLNQRNLATNSLATREAIGAGRDDLRLGFLPLSHIFARTCDLYTWIAAGSELALAESRETVVQNCQEIKPTILNGVPYFFELIRRAIASNPAADEAALRNLLGGRINMCCSGGAALPDHLFDFFQENGVPLLQGYGLTESSPVITVNSEQVYRRGAVGKPIPDVEIAIADDGEVLSRGPHIMVGYWQKPDATDEVVRDGWLHTGDLGRIDDDGFLYITGRKKELIVTAAGKNIAPVLIESLLTEDPAIAQALVIGDDRSFLTALIVPDLGAIGESESAEAVVESAIANRLSSVSHHEQVRKFTLIETPFSIERGEMTPKLSLRRKVIEEHYSAEIAAMYAK